VIPYDFIPEDKLDIWFWVIIPIGAIACFGMWVQLS
jgi:hypothetical protein